MRKNLLALSIAAMVGGLSGAAYAQATVTTASGGLDLITFSSSATNAAIKSLVGYIPGTDANTSDKKNLGLAIPAAATQLDNTVTGIGHILFVPYFTAQGSNHSLLNIVNTDQVNGKAVKLRYRGAANSDDIFDITIYLSPGDVWTADVAQVEGYSRLETSDVSCTLPSAKEIKEANNGRFKTNRVNGNSKAETLEGYIEILNTADIPANIVTGFDAAGVPNAVGTNPLYTAIKHVNGVAPCTQTVMDVQATALGTVSPNTPRERGYSWPTGGLLANWSIVDVSKTASFSGEAFAVRALDAAGANGAGNIVWAPQTSDVVSTANADQLTADPLLTTSSRLATGTVLPIPTIKAASYDFPDLSTPYTSDAWVADSAGVFRPSPSKQANALAAALQTGFITNEYLTNTSVSFATDWVFSMPTRRYATGVDYAGKRAVYKAAVTFTDAATGATYTQPAVDKHFVAANTTLGGDLKLCVDAGNQRAFDREENTRTTFVISPDETLKFCGETSVLSFNTSNKVAPVLGSVIANKVIETKFSDGWFTLNTPGLGAGNGLPVIGYAAAKATGNIGGTWTHRGSWN